MVENKKRESSKKLSDLHSSFTSHLSLTITSLGLLTYINSQKLTGVHTIKLCIIGFALVYTIIGLADFIDGFFHHLDKDVKENLSTWDHTLSYIYMVLGIVMCMVIIVLTLKLFQKNS
jgi:hypothetical protein